MYDSKFGGGDLDASLMHQLALVYRAMITAEEDEDPHLVHVPPVQQQNGSNDCEFLPSRSLCMLLLEMT